MMIKKFTETVHLCIVQKTKVRCAFNRSMKSRNFPEGSVVKTHVDTEADFRAMWRF